MDSTARFLLGGALGAALGYLLSQKNLEKAMQSGQVPVPATAPAGAQMINGGPDTRASAATSPIAPAVAVAPPTLAPERTAVDAPAPAAPGREWTIPPAPLADWRPVPQPPVTTPVSAVPAAPPAPPVEAPAFEPEGAAEASESEVIITREFLEEPIPGSGWRSSAPSVPVETLEDAAPVGPATAWALEDSTSELPVLEQATELQAKGEVIELPVVEDRAAGGTVGGLPPDVLPDAAPVAPPSRAPFLEPTPLEVPSRVDDLKSRIEETRRRIRHELEQPFDTAVAPKPPERDWTVSTAAPVPAVEAVPAEPIGSTVAPESATLNVVEAEPVAAEVAMEGAVAVEPVPTEAIAMEAVEVDLVPVETIALEEVLVEPVALEPVAAEDVLPGPVAAEPVLVAPVTAEPVAAEPAVVEPAPAEQVVERLATVEPPSGEAAAVEAALVEVAPAEPIGGEALVMDQVSAEPLAPERGAVEPGQAEAIAETLAVTAGEGAEVELGLDQPVDYDSMKDRIETTRSRLKAKAFDAMMTGESALLGRDLGDADRSRPKTPGVDSDIDQTIESSLREEEE